MTDAATAALRRKYDATEDLAKRGEFANLLMQRGVDVNAPEPEEKKSATPKGRNSGKRVTTEQAKPTVKADVAPDSNKTSKETAAKTAAAKRGPARPAAPKTTK